MNINNELEDKLLKQPFAEELGRDVDYRLTAIRYAQIENAIAVLSDMKTNTSFICHSGLSERLGIGMRGTSQDITSIWEEDIFGCIHPDDLEAKHLEELRFYHFVMSLPPEVRSDYYLHSHLRMKNAEGQYIKVLHRMFYLDYDANGCARLALCLYHVSTSDSSEHLIVNSLTGESTRPESYGCEHILSTRELEILRLIEAGNMSKEIASKLFISINTVNRHRQNILMKLQASNSVEACRVAKGLGLI
jgi:DNA-binding CsgD family transcriptional regulator